MHMKEVICVISTFLCALCIDIGSMQHMTGAEQKTVFNIDRSHTQFG